MPPYHGKGGVVYISRTGTSDAQPVGQLSNWSLNMETDKVEVTSFGDANKTFVQGLRDVSGELSGFFNSADDILFDAADSPDGCKIYLYPTTLAPTIFFSGPAWLDASIEVDVNGAVAVTASFAANGAWSRKP
jgi:hypothetical protein